jgi:hypothetical protein
LISMTLRTSLLSVELDQIFDDQISDAWVFGGISQWCSTIDGGVGAHVF